MVENSGIKAIELNGRRWYQVNGGYVPSVTSVISEFLTDFSKVDPEVLARAAKFGSAVHDATALEDDGRLDWEQLDPNLKPCVEAWNHCKKQNSIRILQNESIVYSKKYRYAGRFDRVAYVGSDRALIEIKTRKYNVDCDALQTAAYMQAVNETNREAKICHRFVCVLEYGEGAGYQLHEIKGTDHFNIFLSALTLYKWKTTINR